MTLRSILDTVNDAADELVLPRVTSVLGTTPSDFERLMAALVNRQGRALRDAKENGWTVMQRLYTFVTAAGTDEYSLPSDYVQLINDTVWDRSLISPAQGPLSPAQWQTIKSGLIGTGAYSRRFRVVRSASAVTRKFIIDPTPTAIETVAFEYLSEDWCCSSDQLTTREKCTADTDLVLFDDDLMTMGIIWRYKRAKGFEYVSALAEYNERLDQMMSNDAPAAGIRLSGPAPMRFIGYDNIPETGYGS